MKNALIVLSFLLVIFSCSNNKSDKHNFASSRGFEQQWYERHKDEKGEIPENIMNKWQAHDILAFKNAQTRGVSPITAIQQLAPDVPQGGRTRAVLIDISDTTRFFAGGVSGGLWRSTNSGESWSSINDAASSLAVTCITQNPLKPTEIYYATGEIRGGDGGASSGLQTLLGSGVFKSKDGGLTFDLLKSTEGVNDMTRCNYMAHSLTNDATVFLGTFNGLYRSINAGDTWTKVLNGFSTGIISFSDGHLLAGVQNDGIYYSDNNGATFARISGQGFPTGFGHVLLANSKTQPLIVYAWFSGPQITNMGLFKSEDGGKTWTKKTDASAAIPNIGETQGGYNQMLGVHPTKPDWVVIGAQASIMTKDGGVTWERYNHGHPDNHSCIPIGRGEDFIVSNDGGMYKINWNNATTAITLNKGYTTFQFYGGNYGATGTTAISGAQDNGSWRYVNNGVAAEIQSAFIPSGGTVRADGAYAHISLQNPDLAYMSIQFGQVFRSSNFSSPGGGTFEKINVPDVSEGIEFINLFEMNYADGKQLFYRTNKALWRTLNSGKDWERMNLTDINNIHAIGVSNDADPTVYIGGVQNFFRIDKAASFITPDEFVNLRNNIPLNYRTDAWGNISFHPKDKTTLFVGLTSMVSRSRAIRVNKANTAAPEWVEIGGDLPEKLPVYQIQAHPDDPDNVLFAATAFGLYYTLNGGKNWVKETRFPNVPIYELKIRPSDKSLFVFTYGRGLFYSTLNTLTNTKDVVLPENSVNIYPNPANAVVNIKAEYPLSLVQIFSADGREILTEKQNWNIPIGHLQAGMYFIKIYDNKGRFALKKFVKN